MTRSTPSAALAAPRPRFFGTDGMRGAFGEFPLDESTVRRLGRALGRRLRRATASGASPRVVMGGDTRDSTPILAGWLAAELAAEGVDCRWLGVVPTPAVARISAELGAAGAVAISASHNPHPDNGIKLMSGDGFKWPPEWEAELEHELEAVPQSAVLQPVASRTASPAPELTVDEALVRSYPAALVNTLDGERPLAGLTIAVDAGHGAASAFAEDLLHGLGARVHLAHAAPDGRNINQGCGSTHPEVIAELVRVHGADLGLSFDGDADRVILADEKGIVRDGDAVLYLWAQALREAGTLRGSKVVATSMSNLGLEVALRRHGIELVRCEVGDRAVVETLRRENLVLGGEQSGHIVHLDLATTGDGLLTALHVARLRKLAGQPLSEMLDGFERFPQLLKNVRVREKVPFEDLPPVVAARQRVERELANEGRLVLRYSGTEALARVMIEGRERSKVEALAGELAAAIEAEIGA